MKNIVVAAALLAAMALPGSANAATATFFSDHCTGGCGPQPGGFATITANQVGTGVIDVSINLLNGNTVANTGFPLTFGFNLTGDQTVSYSNLSSGFTVVNGTGSNGLTQTAGNYGMDGFGTFEYGIEWNGTGASGNPPSTISFTLTDSATLTLASFAETSSNPPGDTAAFFALDIFSAITRRTGLVDVSGGTTPFPTQFDVPIPPALPLFMAGMVGIGMLRRVTKRFRGDERVA